MSNRERENRNSKHWCQRSKISVFLLFKSIKFSKSFRITYFFHGLIKRGGSVGVKQVPLVGIRGYLVLAEHAMVTQLGHPLLVQFLRFHLGGTQVI